MPNYGTPVDPKIAPPKQPSTTAQPRSFGLPAQVQAPASSVANLRTVALGFSSGAEAPQLPPGMSSRGSNFIAVAGGLIPRPGLSVVSTSSVGSNTSQLGATYAGWIGECQTVTDRHYPIMLAQAAPLVFSGGNWSFYSQNGPAGLSGNTYASIQAAFWDATQYYHPTSDEFELCFVASNAGGNGRAFTLRPENTSGVTGLFSTLTNAPGSDYVTAFDSRLVFASIKSDSGGLPTGGVPQRVKWSARGNPELYTAPDGGFEDLLDAHGVITRIVATEDRLLVFFDGEIWQGLKAPFPFTFQFLQLSPHVGTTSPWTVTKTPFGVVFLGNDLNVYLIPRGGTPIPIATEQTWRLLRETVSNNAQTSPIANGVYRESTGHFILTYRSLSSTEQGVMISLTEPGHPQSPIGFDWASAWSIRRMGITSVQSNQVSTARGAQRVLVAVSENASTGLSSALEMSSRFTSDVGNAIDCRYFTQLGNDDPTQRQFLREVRLDYRCTSASSISLRLTPDFGSTFPIDTGVALPVASLSGQTVIGTALNAIYPGIELRHASGHTFAIQGLTAVVGTLGNG